MDEFDEYLKKLALEAQKNPPRSIGRQRALGKLWNAIQQSGRLYPPARQRIPPGLNYQEVYEEALVNLGLYICKNIDKYNPEQEVMPWVIFYFSTRFIGDAIRYFLKESKMRITIYSLSDLDTSNNLDNIPDPNNQPPCEIKQYFQEDPGDRFKNAHILNRPDANFQAIALLRLENVSWKDISKKFGIKISTLSAFYQRRIDEFIDQIRDDLL